MHFSTVHSCDDSRILTKECRTLATRVEKITLLALGTPPHEPGAVNISPLPTHKNRLARVLLGSWRAIRATLQQDADVYHFHDPELIPVGLFLRLVGKKVVYDAHEDLPLQLQHKSWIPPILRPPLTQLCHILLWSAGHFFSGVVAATPSIARRFPQAKTVLVQNFCRPEEIVLDDPSPYADREPALAYVGGISRDRGIEVMLQAMELVPRDLSACLELAGPVDPTNLLDDLRLSPAWRHVTYHAWLARTDIARLLGRARIGMLILKPTPAYQESYPIKLFEYMAAGLPVIASNFPLWTRIIETHGCGLLVEPSDPHEVARAIAWLLNHPAEADEMGRKGRRAVYEHYSWDTQGENLVRLYERILSPVSA